MREMYPPEMTCLNSERIVLLSSLHGNWTSACFSHNWSPSLIVHSIYTECIQTCWYQNITCIRIFQKAYQWLQFVWHTQQKPIFEPLLLFHADLNHFFLPALAISHLCLVNGPPRHPQLAECTVLSVWICRLNPTTKINEHTYTVCKDKATFYRLQWDTAQIITYLHSVQGFFLFSGGDCDCTNFWEDDPIPCFAFNSSSSACNFLMYSSLDKFAAPSSANITLLLPPVAAMTCFSFAVARVALGVHYIIGQIGQIGVYMGPSRTEHIFSNSTVQVFKCHAQCWNAFYLTANIPSILP